MGLAASQARYLALTARKNDLEYQSQTINSRRIQLAYKTAEIAREYSEGMNNSRIKIKKADDGTTGTTTPVWEEATFANLLKDGYMIIGSEGTALDPAPYISTGMNEVEYACSPISNFPLETSSTQPYARTISAQDYYSLDEHEKALYKGVGTEGTQTVRDAQGATQSVVLFSKYTICTDIDNKTDEGKAMLDAIKWLRETTVGGSITQAQADKYHLLAGYFTTGSKSEAAYITNPDYNAKHGPDIQSLLVSGKGQIVTKAFYDFLVTNGYYSPSVGITGKDNKDFYTLMQEWENNDCGINYAKQKSVIDWRSDESEKFASKAFTEDDEKVLAKYEADTAKVQAQDKQLEIEEKNIETQHKAIETELENIKKVIQKNIEDTFKIFS